MTQTQKEVQKIVDSLLPEAQEIVNLALKNKETKDGYGIIYTTLSLIPKDYQGAMLLACVRCGYPIDTAQTVARLLVSQTEVKQ